ncbi:hypothetical protein SLE2022_274670 [Rubroshorea leprosula]
MSSHLGSVEQITKIFNKYDKNGDGKISFEELKEILGALEFSSSSEEVKRVMSELDTDGDGSVDLDEFIAFHTQSSGSSSSSADNSKELKEAFDTYDLDKNGLISASELHEVLKKLGEKCTLSDCQRMISQVDKDGDGNVNFEEFKKMMSNA